MRKVIFSIISLFLLSGCKNTLEEMGRINNFLTDLSQVYTATFDGPEADDVTKIDFSVKKLYLSNPEKFSKAEKGNFITVDAKEVDKITAQYFSSTIKEPQNTVDVDYKKKEDKYQIMPFKKNELVFSKVDEIIKEKNDTLLLKVNVYTCDKAWKGDYNSDEILWKEQDSKITPEVYKKMRVVIVRKPDGYRLISYTDLKEK